LKVDLNKTQLEGAMALRTHPKTPGGVTEGLFFGEQSGTGETFKGQGGIRILKPGKPQWKGGASSLERKVWFFFRHGKSWGKEHGRRSGRDQKLGGKKAKGSKFLRESGGRIRTKKREKSLR